MATHTKEGRRMSDHFSVAEAARRPSGSLGTEVSPSYKREFGDEPRTIVVGRRLLPGGDLLSIQEVQGRRHQSRAGRREVPRAN
jgi:hypothetical protein